MTIIDKNIFNIINSLFFVFLVFLIFFLSKTNKGNKNDILRILLIIFLIWFFTPSFGSTILWRAGSPNYLWNLCFILTAMLPFKLDYEGSLVIKDSFWTILGFFIVGFIAGMAQENTSAVLIPYSIFFIWFNFATRKKLKYWFFTLFAGCWIGYLVMLIAPGNIIRTNNFSDPGIPGRLEMVFNRFAIDLLPLFIILFVLILLKWYQRKVMHNFGKINYLSLLFIICSIIAFSIMFFARWYPERASFGASIIVIISICFQFNDNYFNSAKFSRFFSFLISLIFVISYFNAYLDLSSSYFAWLNRIKLIDQAKIHNSETIVVDKISSMNSHNPFFNIVDLSDETDGWPNYFIARFYGINSIAGK
jgi:hypothetical protein